MRIAIESNYKNETIIVFISLSYTVKDSIKKTNWTAYLSLEVDILNSYLVDGVDSSIDMYSNQRIQSYMMVYNIDH
jgi:hypothetical protein